MRFATVLCSLKIRIVEGAVSQHCNEHAQPTIGEPAQGAAVRVTFGAEVRVMSSASCIANRADARPMVERIAKPFVATVAHEYQGFLPTLPRNGGGSRVTTEGMVISICDGLRSFAEHRGGHGFSNARQGEKNRSVTMLVSFVWVRRRQLIEEFPETSGDLGALRAKQLEPW